MKDEDLYVRTISGKEVNILNPLPDSIDINDIAWALSKQCRLNGHTPRFYSVAEHSINLAEYFLVNGNRELVKYALLHDAAEAYLGDMPSPVKKLNPRFKEIEENMLSVILTKFGLEGKIPEEVDLADKRIFLDEIESLELKGMYDLTGNLKKLDATINFYPEASRQGDRRTFLYLFNLCFPKKKAA